MELNLNDLVSIVIPSYNRAWCLPAAIESALGQTYTTLEILVMDNCSTDETPAIVASYRDPRLRYFRQPVNVDMASNWGEVLRRACGRYITFLCDDDRLSPDFVANRLPYLVQDDRNTVVFSRYDVEDSAGRHVATHNQDWLEPQTLDGLDLLEAALGKRWFIGTALYRKQTLAAVWERDETENLVLDFGLNIRMALLPEARGVYVPDNDFVMMAHEKQHSNARQLTVMTHTDALLERILQQEALTPLQARCIRRELASWNVLWGRKLAEQQEIQQARRRFHRALRIDPGLIWAWRQTAQAWLCPQRLMRSL
jgi:glycosyltransferase involved in cell wall biosynthesis